MHEDVGRYSRINSNQMKGEGEVNCYKVVRRDPPNFLSRFDDPSVSVSYFIGVKTEPPPTTFGVFVFKRKRDAFIFKFEHRHDWKDRPNAVLLCSCPSLHIQRWRFRYSKEIIQSFQGTLDIDIHSFVEQEFVQKYLLKPAPPGTYTTPWVIPLREVDFKFWVNN